MLCSSSHLLVFFSAAVRYGQRDFPHGGAGCCRRGGRWVTVYLSHRWSDVKIELQNLLSQHVSTVFYLFRTFRPLSHTAGNIWKGKKDARYQRQHFSRHNMFACYVNRTLGQSWKDVSPWKPFTNSWITLLIPALKMFERVFLYI